jgi:hypothetical protein
MRYLRAIGVDPGPVPGLVEVRYLDGELIGVDVMQCSTNWIGLALGALLSAEDGETHVQLEAFVVGNRSARSSTANAGAVTRDVLSKLTFMASEFLPGSAIHVLRATDVKPWATDERLEALGLLEATAGMRHARDAARHALYCAVRFGGVPDPLSRKALA